MGILCYSVCQLLFSVRVEKIQYCNRWVNFMGSLCFIVQCLTAVLEYNALCQNWIQMSYFQFTWSTIFRLKCCKISLEHCAYLLIMGQCWSGDSAKLRLSLRLCLSTQHVEHASDWTFALAPFPIKLRSDKAKQSIVASLKNPKVTFYNSPWCQTWSLWLFLSNFLGCGFSIIERRVKLDGWLLKWWKVF